MLSDSEIEALKGCTFWSGHTWANPDVPGSW